MATRMCTGEAGVIWAEAHPLDEQSSNRWRSRFSCGNLYRHLITRRAFRRLIITRRAVCDENRPSQLWTEVRDPSQSILPSLMRIFTSGADRRIQPRTLKMCESIRRRCVNFVFNEMNPGFQILYFGFKERLKKLGVVSVAESEDRVIERHFRVFPGRIAADDAAEPECELVYANPSGVQSEISRPSQFAFG